MGGKTWVCEGREEEVESDYGLGNETIPFLGDKVGVARGNSGTEMIFEGADHMVGGVAVVGVHRNDSEVNVILTEGFLHGVGALVVEDVESGGCTVLL